MKYIILFITILSHYCFAHTMDAQKQSNLHDDLVSIVQAQDKPIILMSNEKGCLIALDKELNVLYISNCYQDSLHAGNGGGGGGIMKDSFHASPGGGGGTIMK